MFDTLTLGVAPGGSTITDLEARVAGQAAGALPRDGQIDYLSNVNVPIASISLADLVPLSFPPFPTAVNRRSIALSVGSFLFP